jgi:hypothetical protein
VVSVTDPSGRISRFSRQEPLLFYQVAPQFVLTRLSHKHLIRSFIFIYLGSKIVSIFITTFFLVRMFCEPIYCGLLQIDYCRQTIAFSTLSNELCRLPVLSLSAFKAPSDRFKRNLMLKQLCRLPNEVVCKPRGVCACLSSLIVHHGQWSVQGLRTELQVVRITNNSKQLDLSIYRESLCLAGSSWSETYAYTFFVWDRHVGVSVGSFTEISISSFLYDMKSLRCETYVTVGIANLSKSPPKAY